MSLLHAPSETTPLSQLFSLAGKVCLVTGGNRGIGLAVATGFAEAQAAGLAIIHSCAATADLAATRAAEIHAKYPHTEVRVYQADVSKAQEIEDVTRRVFADFGRLDVVVANAGVYTETPALDMKPEEAQFVTGVNYFGPLYTAQAAARIFKENGGGKIIMTASINGHMVLRPQYESIYCATKGAVCHLTRALAAEFAKWNIQVNAVSPGYIDTEMTTELVNKNPELIKTWMNDCPAGRLCKVWELKGVYVFLASGASSYVTGADYVVDGGHTVY
ncbi:NAD(P)-binding protein [Morchella conica CCBAS932]|uniref:NAD(P)-binding protein n=1 Tax=Morchella conica CCBAS932 TaxID=1392247 RepID=A0A3N4L5D1_9PEZI|nr:NAD(P)-binding protein [Morchella conica CCBAS932]